MTDAVAEELARKLDLLIALTRVSVKDALEAERSALEADQVAKEVLATAEVWIGAGALQERVAERTGQSTKTVRRRMADLLARGVLIKQVEGRTVSYRSSGLFDL